MTKKQRIKQLEAEVAELKQRIEALEAKPVVYQWWYPVYPTLPGGTSDNTCWPRCTCGTTAVCPIHGGKTISENYQVG